MRRLFLLIIFFRAISFEAQTPEFVASDIAGIFYYNVEEAIKESKIKKEDHKVKFSNALRKYNDKVKKISFLNTFKFKELDVLVNAANKNPNSLELEDRRNLATKVQEIVYPIKDTLTNSEKKLNATLEKILSSKQQKKWLRYQRAQKKKLLPKQPNDPNINAPTMQNRNRNGRRF